jgi:hypothetical protein
MAVRMWAYGHSDWKYIKAVHKMFGTSSLKILITPFEFVLWTFFKRIKVVSILNYMEYDKDKVMELIQDKLGWVYYRENIMNRFIRVFFKGTYYQPNLKLIKNGASV